MKRTFIAINTSISKETAKLINEIKFELKDEKIKWIESNNLHITLFFLGETSIEVIDNICKSLNAGLSAIKSFSLSCEGIGVFRNIHNPKALWLGIKESENLTMLKNAIDHVMTDVGFEVNDKKFKPHLTIGRTKFIKNKKQFRACIEKYKDYKIQNFEINEVIFYESILTAKGAIYNEIKKFSLD